MRAVRVGEDANSDDRFTLRANGSQAVERTSIECGVVADDRDPACSSDGAPVPFAHRRFGERFGAWSLALAFPR